MIKYSFVVPIYNDAALAEDFCREFAATFKDYLALSDIASAVELIFVNDGSRDDSFDTLKEVAEKFKFARVIDLSRNFGQHIALSCGYQYSVGEYVGMLNVDMEDPPSQIPILLGMIEHGEYDIVFGLRKKTQASLFERLSSLAFHATLNALTGYEVPLNSSTLRVMNRRFVDAYNSLSEKSRYIPGLEMWLGFKRGYTPIRHQPRQRGKSSYNSKRRLAMAVDSILSFSDLPLKLVATAGFALAILGFVVTIGIAITKIFVEMAAGFASIISAIVMFSGAQIFVVGLASLYIGRILREVQNRPLFIVRETFNLRQEEQCLGKEPSRVDMHAVRVET